MIKIKDNVDLKVLKEFGFEEIVLEDCFGKNIVYIKSFKYPCDNNISISSKNRIIRYFNRPNLDTIFDLVSANIVEKIEEKQYEE